MRINGSMIGLTETLKICDDAESKFSLAIVDNSVRPTVDFLRSIADGMTMIGLAGCTPTIAWQVWLLACEIREQICQSERQNAELAFWYGIDPYGLTEHQRIGLVSNLPRIQAQRRLSDGNYDPTDWMGVYNLVLLATGDEKAAVRARGDAQELAARAGR